MCGAEDQQAAVRQWVLGEGKGERGTKSLQVLASSSLSQALTRGS